MKRVGNSTIQFRELHPYMFCEGYRVPKGNSGRYQLTFTTPQGLCPRTRPETFADPREQTRDLSWRSSIESKRDDQHDWAIFDDCSHTT